MATLKPAIASGLFPTNTQLEQARNVVTTMQARKVKPLGPVEEKKKPRSSGRNEENDFPDDDLDDADILATVEPENEFQDIDDVVSSEDAGSASLTGKGKARAAAKPTTKAAASSHTTSKAAEAWQEPKRLPNGNWECRHQCTDKQACKHPCCKQGSENKPKPSSKKSKKENGDDDSTSNSSRPAAKKAKKNPTTTATHTDPFTASKKTTKQASSSNKVATANVRSTTDDEFEGGFDENDLWDELGNDALNENGYSHTSAQTLTRHEQPVSEKGLFVTSSPSETRKYDSLDLSSEGPSTTAPTQPQPKKRRRASSSAADLPIPFTPQYYDDQERCVSLRDLENACNVTTFSKPQHVSRANRHQHTTNLEDMDTEAIMNCNDAPYGWAPITTSDPPVVDENGMPYPDDNDEDMGVIEYALYPTSFTAVNQLQPRLEARGRGEKSLGGAEAEREDVLPSSLMDMIQPTQLKEVAEKNEDIDDHELYDKGLDFDFSIDNGDDFEDEGYTTMQIDAPSAPAPVPAPALALDTACPSTSVDTMAVMRQQKQSEDEQAKQAVVVNVKEEKEDEYMKWVYAKYGDVAEFT